MCAYFVHCILLKCLRFIYIAHYNIALSGLTITSYCVLQKCILLRRGSSLVICRDCFNWYKLDSAAKFAPLPPLSEGGLQTGLEIVYDQFEIPLILFPRETVLQKAARGYKNAHLAEEETSIALATKCIVSEACGNELVRAMFCHASTTGSRTG